MTHHVMPARLTVGASVRIDGRAFVVGGTTEMGRIFTSRSDGRQMSLSMPVQIQMMRDMRLTSEASFQALDANTLRALKMDWDAFTLIEKMSAERKHPFVVAVDELPAKFRGLKQKVDAVAVDANGMVSPPYDEVPSFRKIRRWYRKWIVAGRDARALVDFHTAKGNRTPRMPTWMHEEIQAAIDEVFATDPPGTAAAAWERARDRVLLRANKEGLFIPPGAKNVVGKNIVARAIRARDQYDLAVKRLGKREADKLFSTVAAGPDGRYPLHEVEIDHTTLDMIVVHENGAILGRPYLTVLIDRHTRMILGFAIGFTPPSWTSVMEALAMAVLPKDDFLARMRGSELSIVSDWPCFGPPDVLFVDRGAEFRSASMRAAEMALNMRIVDLPPGSPWLKGKIERWFRTLNLKLLHRLPGTTSSNVGERRRKGHDPEGSACLTLDDLRRIVGKWIVDVYHREIHSSTGRTPLEAWKDIDKVGPKLPPPRELLAPLVGFTPYRKLQRDGVRFNRLRWNSNGFQALRTSPDCPKDVLIRIDPHDLRTAYVLDENTGVWIEGELQSESEVENLTLAQYQHLRVKSRELAPVDLDEQLDIARARQAIFDFVADRRPGQKVPKRLARFVSEGRKPVEHVRPERVDPLAQNIDTHPLEVDAGPAQSPRGPWREPVLPRSRLKKPARDEPTVVRAVDTTPGERGELPAARKAPDETSRAGGGNGVYTIRRRR